MEASSISGVGISYGYRFLSVYMFKLCGLYFEKRDKVSNPLNPDEKDYLIDIWWDAGAEIQRNFFTIPVGNNRIECYGLIGGSYWF